MPNYVPGEGNASAKLMVIGEAPGKCEDEASRPFVGPSGQLVDEMLSTAGIHRAETYITNVVKIRPPDNDLKRLNELGKKIDDYISILWQEINAIKPNSILALGDLALKTLTGKHGITKYRGSILESKQGYPKVIPSIHPAMLLEHRSEGIYNWKQRAYIQLDFNRAVEQSKFKEFRLPQRNLWTVKNSVQLMDFLERNKHNDKVSVDIETSKCIPICIGLAFTRYEGVSVPLLNLLSSTNLSGIGLNETAFFWQLCATLLADPNIKKIGHNYKFDQRILNSVGIITKNFYSDTMLKFHTLYPEFPKRLEFVSSILTEEPYYKDEYKEFNPKKDDISKVFLYNAKDACVTKEVDEIMEGYLKDEGLMEFFYGIE